jgi:serine/threonine-protein kinase
MNSTYILKTYPGATQLQKGGQKEVYKYNHPQFGWCVLKIGQCTATSGLERIKREVEILKEIDSDYFPRQYDFTLPEASTFLIIEEFIAGTPLSGCMNNFYDPRSAVLLILDIIEGMKILWSKRVIHRDLKPQNIIVNSMGKPVIIDLGIARILDDSSITDTLATAPMTPFYAAPEQIQYSKSDISPKTDQFNLGIILAQLLLCGEHPFSPVAAGGLDICSNIINGQWAKIKLQQKIDSELLIIIEKMLGSEPYLRYRRIDDLTNDFENYIGRIQ